MSLTIDILTTDGSPLGVTPKSIYGEDGRMGVGGAELALLTMCEEWSKRGDTVRLYNNPTHTSELFEQLPINAFARRDDRDVLIAFRSPTANVIGANGLKVWWSCDQFTIGEFAEFRKRVHRVVTISPFHARYFAEKYGIEDSITIDIPVRIDDYSQPVEKVHDRVIFTSVPDRGLDVLASAWPYIRKLMPSISLVITSDYRLWGCAFAGNEHFRTRFLKFPEVKFLGAVKRQRLIEEQLQAQILAYPCTYDELFCITCAEAQVAGAYPVTSMQGALETTNMGRQIEGSASSNGWTKLFAETLAEELTNPELVSNQEAVRKAAIERFDPKNILNQWDEKVFI